MSLSFQLAAGWTIIGKKETCPCCFERVDLRSLYADRPWETRNLTWCETRACFGERCSGGKAI